MRTKKDHETQNHSFRTENLSTTTKALKNGNCEIRLKKKTLCCCSRTIESQQFKLVQFMRQSYIEKKIKLGGNGPVEIQLKIHKATHANEFERVQGKKLTVGPILPAYIPKN